MSEDILPSRQGRIKLLSAYPILSGKPLGRFVPAVHEPCRTPNPDLVLDTGELGAPRRVASSRGKGCNVTTNVISVKGHHNVTTMAAHTSDGGADLTLPSINVNRKEEKPDAGQEGKSDE